MLENFSPRVLGNFGLGLGARSTRSTPAASSCACPRSGCRARGATTSGFAQTMEQVTGLAWITGPRRRPAAHPAGPERSQRRHARRVRADRRPRRARGHRARVPARGDDGRGRAQRRRRAGDRGDRLRQPARARRQPQPERRAAGALPRAAATRQWLAISVATDDAVGRVASTRSASRRGRAIPSSATLRRTAGRATTSSTTQLGGVERRARRRARRSELLVAHGVPAALGRDPRSLMRPSAAAGAAGSTRRSTTRSSACSPRPRVPFRFASVDRWLRTPAPTLGQHNHEILVEDLGVDEATYQRLVDTSIIGDRPLGL